MNQFHEILEDEIRTSEVRARAHERTGSSDLADWWRRRGEDLRTYLEGARLQDASLSPGQAPVTRPRSPALRRTG